VTARITRIALRFFQFIRLFEEKVTIDLGLAMGIGERPYSIPASVARVQEELNARYDSQIKGFINAIVEFPWPTPSLKISVTNRCNLSCKYCYDRISQPPNQMPVDMTSEFLSLVLGKWPKPTNVFLLGGEPFLNPSCVVAALEKCCCRVSVSTNGQVSGSDVDQILRIIRWRRSRGRSTVLQVSCEEGGGIRARHAEVSEGTLHRWSAVCGDQMKVKYTMTEDDIDRIEAIATWYWERGLLVQFDYADGGYGTGVEQDLMPERQKHVYEFVLQTFLSSVEEWTSDPKSRFPILKVKTLLNIALPSAIIQLLQRRPVFSRCGILGYSIYVSPTGRMHPCHRLRSCDYGDFIAEVGEIDRRLKEFHREIGLTILRQCGDCIWRGTCGGVCPAVVHLFGDRACRGRCKFHGTLGDAALTVMADERYRKDIRFDRFLCEIFRLSPHWASLEDFRGEATNKSP